MNDPWSLYDQLIGGIDDGPLVKDYCVGTNWSYIEAECGFGVAWTATGGSRRKDGSDIAGRPLRQVAELAKSWRYEDATLGVAALNAWYSAPEQLAKLDVRAGEDVQGDRSGTRGGREDAFTRYRPAIEARGGAARVVVVGHFPTAPKLDDACELTILERVCRDEWDTPDPACEYVLPGADFAFITGVTLINKTAPRLLELARGAHTVMVGPSVVLAPALFEHGADVLSGSIVADPEAAKNAVKRSAGKMFGSALKMCEVRPKGSEQGLASA